MFFPAEGVNATVRAGLSLLGTAEQRRRAILRSRILRVVVSSEPGDAEPPLDRMGDSLDELDARASCLRYVLVTKRAAQPRRRKRDSDRDVDAHLVRAAEPVTPSGTSMSLGPDGSLVMSPAEHIGNRVASGFVVIPVIHSRLDRRDLLALRIVAAAPDAGTRSDPTS